MGRAADKAAVAVGFQWIVVMAEQVCDDAGEFLLRAGIGLWRHMHYLPRRVVGFGAVDGKRLTG